MHLPGGSYNVEFSRGPESITKKEKFTVSSATKEMAFKVERWIDPSKMGWWSGDHHIHAAGCAHNVKPTEGVLAEDMILHVMGDRASITRNSFSAERWTKFRNILTCSVTTLKCPGSVHTSRVIFVC